MVSVPAVGHGVARVDREVQDHLLDLARVGPDVAECVGEPEREVDVLADQPAQHALACRATTVVQIDDGRLEDLLPAERQQLARERGGALAGLPDLLAGRCAARVALGRSTQQPARCSR